MFRQMVRIPEFSNLKSEISDLISLCESVSRQLRGWLDSVQNSDITGARYLTDAARAEHDRRRRAQTFLEELRCIAPLRSHDLPDPPAEPRDSRAAQAPSEARG